MRHLQKFAALAVSTIVPLIFFMDPALASNTEPSTTPVSGCSDYRLVSGSSEKESIDLRCVAMHASEQQALLEAIERIDPAAEAKVASENGDFRLAAIVGRVVHQNDSYISSRFWVVEGVECKALENADVVIWLQMSDALVDAAQVRLQTRMLELRRAYNVALITDPSFPAGRGCKPLLG